MFLYVLILEFGFRPRPFFWQNHVGLMIIEANEPLILNLVWFDVHVAGFEFECSSLFFVILLDVWYVLVRFFFYDFHVFLSFDFLLFKSLFWFCFGLNLDFWFGPWLNRCFWVNPVESNSSHLVKACLVY